MKKIFNLSVLILPILFLSACSSENINGNTNENISVKKDMKEINNNTYQIKDFYKAETKKGSTDFFAININNGNFKKTNKEINDVLEMQYLDDTKVQIALISSNHGFSYEDIDYLNQTTLSGKSPKSFQIIESRMGGHHVSVLLNFPLGTPIDILEFNDSPVGNITLQF